MKINQLLYFPPLGNCSCVAYMDVGEGREQERKLCSTTYIHVGVPPGEGGKITSFPLLRKFMFRGNDGNPGFSGLIKFHSCPVLLMSFCQGVT
jgi:hypothetical protein